MKIVDALLKAPMKRLRIFGMGGEVVEVAPEEDDCQETGEQEILRKAEIEQALEDFRRMENLMSGRDS